MHDDTNPDAVIALCARWPSLAALLNLPGARWRILVRPDGQVCCQRAHEHFVETVHIADPRHVGANRLPIGHPDPALVTENFSGTLRDAITFLTQPPRWGRNPRHF